MKQKLQEDLKQAMKAGDQARVLVIRGVISEAKYKEVELHRPLEGGEILALMQSGIKKRRDSIALYKQGNRHDLADNEEKEIAILETYLPKALAPEDTGKLVDAVLAELGVTSRKEVGKVMKVLMERHRGVLDGKAAQQYLMQKLAP